MTKVSWGYYNQYPEYATVAEKKAKAKKKIKALRKKGEHISPIEIDGRTIAKSWWGKAWNKNLQEYSDFSNRLSRGRSYVTHGCVIDLQITEGKIMAQVMGSGSSVYKCLVEIKPINMKKWTHIKKLVGNSISSITELLAGKFPKELESVFSLKGKGLFPDPEEFSPNCSCPDYAQFCKHLAAVIYGVGNRLDSAPELLFTLRGIDSNELVAEAIADHKDNLIAKAEKIKSKRLIKLDEKELSTMFDIDFSMPN